MDNQQAKMHFDLGFLVGFLEGEGSLTLNRTGTHKLQPFIGLTNCNMVTFDRVVEIVRSFNLPHHVDKKYKTKKGRQIGRIHVVGQGRCQQWLDLLMPHLVGKRRQGEILTAYIAMRRAALSKHPFHKPYTDAELLLWDEIHALNTGNARAPETTRRKQPATAKV
ncbi:MAG: hypothetical protein ACREYE_28255 [Gammaproteobacteria bacterium]